MALDDGLAPGPPVVGSDGMLVGRVRAVHATDLLVGLGPLPDLAVPFGAVAHVAGDMIVLGVPAELSAWP